MIKKLLFVLAIFGLMSVPALAETTKEVTVVNTPDVNVANTPDVNVVNTLDVNIANQDPIPVIDIGNSATQSVTWTDSVEMANNAYGVIIFSIPSGKILVIEHVTSEIIGQGSLCGLYANLSIGSGGLVPVGVGSYFNSTGPGLTSVPRYVISQPMRVYVENSQVGVQAFRCGDTNVSATLRSTISGYLVDSE